MHALHRPRPLGSNTTWTCAPTTRRRRALPARRGLIPSARNVAEVALNLFVRQKSGGTLFQPPQLEITDLDAPQLHDARPNRVEHSPYLAVLTSVQTESYERRAAARLASIPSLFLK